MPRKIYYNDRKNVITVTGTKKSFLPKSLTAEILPNNKIIIWEADGTTAILKTNYTNVLDKNDNPFQTIEDCKAYLDLEFNKSETSGTTSSNPNIILYEEIEDEVYYKGTAEFGTSETLNLWKIQKISVNEVTKDFSIEYPDGQNLNNKSWDLRSTYSYSA